MLGASPSIRAYCPTRNLMGIYVVLQQWQVLATVRRPSTDPRAVSRGLPYGICTASLGVPAQRLRRDANGANEPRAIAELARRDGDGSGEECRQDASNPLIQLGPHTDASSEHDELQIKERLECHYSEGHPARRRVEYRRRQCVSFLQEAEDVAHRGGRGSTPAAVSIHDAE